MITKRLARLAATASGFAVLAVTACSSSSPSTDDTATITQALQQIPSDYQLVYFTDWTVQTPSESVRRERASTGVGGLMSPAVAAILERPEQQAWIAEAVPSTTSIPFQLYYQWQSVDDADAARTALLKTKGWSEVVAGGTHTLTNTDHTDGGQAVFAGALTIYLPRDDSPVRLVSGGRSMLDVAPVRDLLAKTTQPIGTAMIGLARQACEQPRASNGYHLDANGNRVKDELSPAILTAYRSVKPTTGLVISSHGASATEHTVIVGLSSADQAKSELAARQSLGSKAQLEPLLGGTTLFTVTAATADGSADVFETHDLSTHGVTSAVVRAALGLNACPPT